MSKDPEDDEATQPDSAAPVSVPSSEIIVPIKLYYFDTDAAGVVHNIAYLRLVEVARSNLAEQMGWTLAEMHASGRVPVLTRTEIDYLYPARMGDSVEIHGRLESFDRVRFHFAFELRDRLMAASLKSAIVGDSHREHTPRVYIRCRQTLATLKMPEGKLLPTPDSWRKAYPHLYSRESRG